MGKFYAVKVGRKPGIYNTWNECKENTNGFSGAQFHSFKTLEEANEYMGYNSESYNELNDASKITNQNNHLLNLENVETDAFAYIDGSFNPKTFVYGCGIYLNHNGEECCLKFSDCDEEMKTMRNVAGELMGAIKVIEKCIELKIKSLTIYYDYQGIEKWANDEWRRNLKGTKDYYEFIQNARNSIDICFKKVAAHTGVYGNELADQLAKEAVGII